MNLKLRSLVFSLALALLLGGLFGTPNQIFGQTVTLEISGTYDTNGGSIYGENGTAIPYSYTIDYNPLLDTNTQFFDIGDSLGGSTTIHQWYGYSASGVVSSDFTFGTKTFDLSTISTPAIETGVQADFWFDTDISTDAPSLFYFSLTDFVSEPGLLIAGDIEQGGGIHINSFTRITDFFGSTSNNDTFATITMVPEPTSLGILSLGALALALRRRRKS